MPSSNPEDTVVTVLKNAGSWAQDAQNFGPFFFGVFLVLVAVVLILLNKSKYISSIFASSGILFMVTASLIYSGVTAPVYAYTMRLGNLASNHALALTDSSPRVYRRNFVHDIDLDAYHVDLITISPSKLQEGHSLRVVIVETLNERNFHHRLSLPFKGTPHSTYELAPLESQDAEEAVGGYQIVENSETPPIHDLFARFNHSLVPVALAQGAVTIEQTSPVGEIEHVVGPEVIYFERSVDRGQVAAALDSADIEYGKELSASDNPSNAVWIGTDVPADLAARIGKALLSANIGIKYFGYFTYRETKTNVVQIGYSKLNRSNRLVSQSDIDAFLGDFRSNQKQASVTQQQDRARNDRIEREIISIHSATGQ